MTLPHAGGLSVAALLVLLQAPGILGSWRGTSTCVDKVAFPSCNDEIVVYDVTRLTDSNDSVKVMADKIVNGQREFMGELHFAPSGPGEWRSEFTNPRVHIRITLTIAADRLTGTMLDVRSGKLVRRIVLDREKS